MRHKQGAYAADTARPAATETVFLPCSEKLADVASGWLDRSPADADTGTLKHFNDNQQAHGNRHMARVAMTAEQGDHQNEFEGFIGASRAMRDIYAQIERVAGSRAPVFITGESGTGKEITAHAVHSRSTRLTEPLVAINCSAIPSELMESEMFGHLRGAFTGAVADRMGAAEAADGGTLFLDEICEMDLSLQAKLLRFLQTGKVRRVGDTTDRDVDVRVICATNRDPEAEIAAGRFREDLYYRLHVLPLHLPPLRERQGDIPALARHFLRTAAEEEGRQFRDFDPDAMDLVIRWPWPGNVRQLQNVVRRLVVMNDRETVSAEMLSVALAQAGTQVVAGGDASSRDVVGQSASVVEPFWIEEKRIIERAIAHFDGNVGKAAAALDISPSTIYRKRQAWTSGNGFAA